MVAATAPAKPAEERREAIHCPACRKLVLRATLPPGRVVLEPYCPRCKRVFVVVLH